MRLPLFFRRPRFAAAASALLLALAVPVGATATAGQDTPSATVETLNAALLDVMQRADALGFEGRYDALEPVIRDSFQLQAMLAAAVGGAERWNSLPDPQRTDLLEAFARMSVSTYASRFDGYGGETLSVAGERTLPSDRVMVRAVLTTGDGETINLDYVLTETDAGWRIVDVMLDGRVSELSRQRSEYSAVLEAEGVDGLISRLRGMAERRAGNG